MIVIAGGTGRLGRILVERFRGRDEPVRVLSRRPEGAARAAMPGTVEIVAADVRDRAALERAVAGARVVISAMSAFGMKGVTLREVDLEGNANLIGAAEGQGVERFILVSVRGASSEHPMELSRMKYLAEQRLMRSRLCWTILRPSSFTETFQAALCAPLLERGRAVVLGRAANPINFVSVHDVARFVDQATTGVGFAGAAIDLGGPENLSLVHFVEAFGGALGVQGRVRHIPRAALRLLSRIARPFSPTFARMAQAAVVMDTTDMAFDATELQRRHPDIRLTTVAEAARRDYAGRVAQAAVTA